MIQESIKIGMVFHRGRFTYIVMQKDSSGWICYSPNAQVTQHFSSKFILSLL